MGDDYFLPVVHEALAQMLDQRAGEDTSAGGTDRSVELILTGTLWQEPPSTTTWAQPWTEVDHDARFRFTLNADASR